MLTLNWTAYGYALGLTIAPWFAGVLVSFAFSLSNLNKVF